MAQANHVQTDIPRSPNAKSRVGMEAKPVDSHSVARRLQSELMSLMTSGDAGISAFPEGDNIFNWVGTIKGSVGTVYEGLNYKLSLKFPTDYPFKAPMVRFETPCFHPNVDQYGNICLDILKADLQSELRAEKVAILEVGMRVQSRTQFDAVGSFPESNDCDFLDKWSAVYNVRTILLSIQSLLGEPNNDSPLNGYAAAIWPNQEEYKVVLQKKFRETESGGVSS